MRDLLKEMWNSLQQNKLRTALTGFSVAWGIFMLIVLLGAGNGLLNALMNNSGTLAHSMAIYPGYTSKPYGGFDKWREIKLDAQDVRNLEGKAFMENVDEVSPVVSHSDTLAYGMETFACELRGVTPIYKEIDKIQLIAGRFINALDIKEQRRCIVVARNDAEVLAGRRRRAEEMLGKEVAVGAFLFKVVGIYKSDESFGGTRIYAPFTTLRTLYAKGKDIEEIYFSFHGLDTEEQNQAFEKRYRTVVNVNHGAAPDDDRTVYIWNRLIQNMQMGKAERIIRTALWILGLLTLLSGIVGVSNIMLITVKERTHEFGIRKAIGARPRSLMGLVVLESVAITAFFGYIGMFFGLVANEIMNATIAGNPVDMGVTQITMFVNPTVGLDVAVQATLTLIVAGTLAGLIPAWKAAKVKPIEALRAE